MTEEENASLDEVKAQSQKLYEFLSDIACHYRKDVAYNALTNLMAVLTLQGEIQGIPEFTMEKFIGHFTRAYMHIKTQHHEKTQKGG